MKRKEYKKAVRNKDYFVSDIGVMRADDYDEMFNGNGYEFTLLSGETIAHAEWDHVQFGMYASMQMGCDDVLYDFWNDVYMAYKPIHEAPILAKLIQDVFDSMDDMDAIELTMKRLARKAMSDLTSGNKVQRSTDDGELIASYYEMIDDM